MQDNIKFDMRVVGIIKNGDKILLQHSKNLGSFALPGGGCTLLEDSQQAIIREMSEEIGDKVNIHKLLFITEDFFKYKDMIIHQIAFYYLLSLEENSYRLKQEEFNGIEEGKNLVFKWAPINEIEKDNFVFKPEFLKDKFRDLENKNIQHYIIKEY